MKAIVNTEYGSPDVLQLKEVEKPVPQDNEVLIRVHASSINFADNAILTGNPFVIRFYAGLSKPKFPVNGADIAGRVEAVSKNVTRFKIGDEVFGDASNSGRGAYAEYATVSENDLTHKPANVTYEQAAAVPLAGITALQGVRNTAQVQAGEKVMIHGASGGVGTFALLIAKALGAEVTAVVSTRNIEMARSLGADHVIDYKKEDFTQSNECYDVIIATNGNRSVGEYKGALKSGGRLLVLGGTMRQIFQSMIFGSLVFMSGDKKFLSMGSAQPNPDDLADLADLLEAGKIVPYIDTCFPLEKTAEAFRYFNHQHAQGKVVIAIPQAT